MTLIAQELKNAGLPQNLNLEAVLKQALHPGGDLAELFFENTDSTRISFENNRVDKVVDGTDGGVGLRILFDNRSIYGYTTDLSQDSLIKLATSLSKAVENAKKVTPKFDWQIARSTHPEMSVYTIKRDPRSIALQAKVDYLKRADRAVRQSLSEVKQVVAIWMNSNRKILVVNSDGIIAPDQKTYLHMVVQVVGERDGRIESAYASDGGYVGLEFFEQVTPESIGNKAAERVRILLGAKPAPAGTMTVILAGEAGGTMIHEAVGHGLEADLACNGLSVYQNKIGQQVASPLISVLDDGTIPAKRGSFKLDDEGTPAQKNVLIENGILKGYMVDRLSAMKFDLMATGNGRRESFRHKPIVRMTNTYIAPGSHDPKKILEETQQGIFVKGIGGGEVNTVTGDFVFAVTEGYLIENGKIGAPIRGATLVGNGPKVMSEVDRVGNDLGWAPGTCGKDGQGAPVTDAQPTIRIPNLTVGGEVPMNTYWK